MGKKIFLIGILLLFLTGCGETEEERLEREVREARESYYNAVNDYYEAKADIELYQYYSEQVSRYR